MPEHTLAPVLARELLKRIEQARVVEHNLYT
jgi:hypothetical protein